MQDQLRVAQERGKEYQRLLDRFEATPTIAQSQSATFTGLSLIIAYYDIPDQIQRTLVSCSASYQGCEETSIEVIIADNGSKKPFPEQLQSKFPVIKRVLRTDGRPSPVFALNEAMQYATHNMIGVMIDGAHILSPGIFKCVEDVFKLFENPVINVPQYILGDVSQNLSSNTNAFNRESEVLSRLNWPEEGYRLFDHALYPGESPGRDYMGSIESNCLIAPKSIFERYGMFDERFDEPGGGFANLDLFSRLTHQPDTKYVLLPGEGTFHQNHGGTTTQKSPQERDQLVREYRKKYKKISGSELIFNPRSPLMYGNVKKAFMHVPTISHEFRTAKNKLLKDLAKIYVDRLKSGSVDVSVPELVVGTAPNERLARPILRPVGIKADRAKRYSVQEKDLNYLNFLRSLHRTSRPELYFEIGVDKGMSLSIASCLSVAVDPSFCVDCQIDAPSRLFRMSSDEFFDDYRICKDTLECGIDLAFIDGMHLAEFVVRDFANTEKWMKKGGVIVFDDTLPEQLEMAARDRNFNAWCGDVFKVVPILRKYRPDLNINVFEAFIGPYRKGIAVIQNFDPENSIISDNYSRIKEDILSGMYDVDSIEQLEILVGVSDIQVFFDITK
ncbi:MAG: class I SAM-dependent methyltransferase [Pseudomonadota bacterium]